MFCGRDRTLSREHVFNRWMREHVVRRVCRDCNHGWTQHMDNEVRPIIEPMLDGIPRTLLILDQNTVATWATKITLVLQAANMGRQAIVGDDQYRWFEQHRQPLPGWRRHAPR